MWRFFQPLGTQLEGIISFQGIARDITARKRSEEENKKQLDELQRGHHLSLRNETCILDLKREVNELTGEDDQPWRYPSADFQDEQEKLTCQK